MKKEKKKVGILLGIALAFSGGIGGIYQITQKKSYQNATAEIYTIKDYLMKQKTSEDLKIRAKSAYLMDFCSETVIYAQKELDRLPIASMCKIMTLILSFEAIENGIMNMDDTVTVSERAASMGGSQVFLEANAKYSVRELIKSIVVCSANDSCVAMAEKIAGSEEIFVQRMNEKAKSIGATNTLFSNCTGLPKEPQYSCAKDVAIMLKNLLKHEEYYQFGKVWMDKFQHPEGRYTEISNTNKLVRFYDGCDGGKTGFTNDAGFCLAATAKRDNMRIISVVIGEENSNNRFDDVRTMFDYAFANYTASRIVEEGKPLSQNVKIEGGKRKDIPIAAARDVYDFSRQGEKGDTVVETRIKKIKAPIDKGQTIGELVIYRNGIEAEKIPLLALESVKKATVFDHWKEIAGNWTAK